MPLMEWNPKMSVGVAQFDDEHKKLVTMVNDLFDAVQAGRGQSILGPILDGLIGYTATHFANEEKVMEAQKYPQFAAHKAEHDALKKQVLDVQAKFKAGASAALSLEVMSFLKNWLIKHIMGSDKSYTPHLNQHGVK